MKIFKKINRKENFNKNLKMVCEMVDERILDQKDILKEQVKQIKDFLAKNEITDENEAFFYTELCELMENRETMIKKINSWIESEIFLKTLEDENNKKDKKCK